MAARIVPGFMLETSYRMGNDNAIYLSYMAGVDKAKRRRSTAVNGPHSSAKLTLAAGAVLGGACWSVQRWA
jgi:hypothetical protein